MIDDGVAERADASGSAAPRPSVDPDPGSPTQGDRGEAWFEDLFAAHAHAVFRYFARRGAHGDAEDLAADVLTTAWRRRGDVPRGHELAWLYRTAGYVLANHRRKGRPVPVGEIVEDSLDELAPDPADLAVADQQVAAALSALSGRDRHILLLHAWEGLDGAELGHALGVTRGGAAAALSRARARLRDAWGETA
ncbi:RNA polymerase sigma factor [Ruania halotolerans]|uniref:RNA polymerase sigma factor n=1 Tax=Ruania halotolerans TaxID=2897773 RepID=UPI001E650DC7|nr:sigma-70 family RNA polymerase sigma factor [Ruania halotolerans]UFU07156.1 sigma-70 family RNA polymerase sigma factor [Ruania halotolerans]